MTRLGIGLLGPLEASVDDVPVEIRGTKQRALLATLALQHDEVVAVGTIVAGLWDEPPPDRAEHTLQQHVSSLRKALEPNRDGTAASVLVTKEPGYRLHVDALDVDADAADVAAAASAAARGDHRAALVAFERADGRVRGAPLSDVGSTLRLDAAATRIQERIDDADAARVDVMLTLGMHREAIPRIEHLVERQPYREGLRAQLMLALYRADRQTDALATFRATRALLVEELGVEPSRSLRDLEEAILRQDPALDHGAPPIGDLARTMRADEHSEFGCIELPDGQVIALGASAVIGRAPDAAIRVVDSRVSREHARIEHDGSGPRIVDLGSTNGTTVNEVRVHDHHLADGDAIGLGGFVVRYRATARHPDASG